MAKRIAVETLTLGEVSKMFQESFDIAEPKFNNWIQFEKKKLKKWKITRRKWVKSYEEFIGAKISFYCEFRSELPDVIVSVGMTHRTSKGLVLVCFDPSNGGIPANGNHNMHKWDKWIHVYTEHYCERFAERIMKASSPTFQTGAEGIMYADIFGPVRFTDTLAEGVHEIEFQFQDGMAFGYRDTTSKITYYKTVYSNDMLKKDRLQYHEEWKEPLSQIAELFKWK
jgi:hypothetical protein